MQMGSWATGGSGYISMVPRGVCMGRGRGQLGGSWPAVGSWVEEASKEVFPGTGGGDQMTRGSPGLKFTELLQTLGAFSLGPTCLHL